MFQKHRIALLEQIIKDHREAHAERVAELKEAHQKELDVLNRHIAELKSAHAAELLRVIEERDRLRDDLDRTRLFLNPGLGERQIPSRTLDTSGPPVPADVPVGGAWARVLARYKKEDEEQQRIEESEKKRKAVEIAAKENPDGHAGQAG